MKKLLSFLLLVLYTQVSFAQEVHFFDAAGNSITYDQFELLRRSGQFLGLSFQKGKTTETRLFPRFETGVISQQTRNEILLNLEKEKGSVVNRNELLLITYHQRKDPCNSSGGMKYQWEMRKEVAQRQRRIKQLGLSSEYYLYATPDGIRNFYNHLQWYPDRDLLVEKTFFKYKYPCKSFVIIKPDGGYYACFGEFRHDQMIDQAKKFLE